ncbi:hypothetical protein H6G89_13780 [Oscillatoria sp. FACHB-1407]|uniref:hypothetical protein n=1 Tax=Oscillatoria sp. FACHB-1407 TaxID=2692847 RepID=UPI001684E756|nr:hypothetical protein [Oscillatoria sp. FACHB-1407]MBD2462118.1 hypothetical protein [Oscillatoria sp. FACHB-1407]
MTTIDSAQAIQQVLGIDSTQVTQQVLDLVDGYVQAFQPPLTQACLTKIAEAAIAQTIPPLKGVSLNEATTAISQLKDVSLDEASIKQRILQEVMTRFNPLAALNRQVNPDTLKLAANLHQQITNFTPEKGVAEALNVLDAYVQQYKPSVVPAALYPVVKTILPQIKGLRLTPDTLERLATQAILKFSPELVPTKVLSPQARAIALLVARQIQNFQPQEAVMGVLGVLDAYVQQTKMTPTEATLYQIAKQVIPNLVKTAMSDDQKNQFATQVMFQFKKRPGPIKSPDQAARDIAAKLVGEVEQMRSLRAQELRVVDMTKPLAVGDLEVRSAFVIQP